MSRELLESKLQNDYFAGNDDTYSSLKHEFSRIFHENNLHSFANASDIGFLNVEKLGSHGIADNGFEDSYQHQAYQQYQNYQGYPSYAYANPQKGSNSPFLTRLNSDSNPIYSQSPMTYGQNQGPSVTYSTGANKQVPVPGSPSYYYQGYQYQNYGQAESPYLDYSTPTTGSYPSGQGYDEYIAHELIDTHPNNALGLMWSNDVAKNTTEPKQHKEEKAAYKVEQEFGSISNKKLNQQMDKAKNGNEPSAGLRRTTRVNTKISYNTIGKDDEDMESGSDDDKEDGYGESKGRRSRGLRVLSLKVREIVSKRDRTSYKEVADALLEDLAQKMKGRPQSEIAKEEQNVKRRVYDALNVLIAAEILEKDGKQVSLSNTRPVSSGNSQKKKTKGQGPDRETLLDMIEAAKQRKQEKQDALQELVFKNLAVKNLIKKNKTKEEAEATALSTQGLGIRRGVSQATRIDVVEENASLKQQSQDNISFPFIVIVSGSAENSMNINMDASQKQLSIDSRKAFDIYGDIDVLLKMKLHYVSKSMFETEVSKPLRRYISPQFISELGK